MKVFISQEYNGKTADEIAVTREDALYLLKRALRARKIRGFGHEEKAVVIDDYTTELDPIKALSKSIECMSEADIVMIPNPVRGMRNCMIEERVAESFGLPIYYYKVGYTTDKRPLEGSFKHNANRYTDESEGF